ncbi:[FeFe] hydrogenase H-cluster radical SAM maturase HydG [Candidatus Caldatribacterium sp.]|uniref:[FeFe] hydrogenase H-cluster radical SAM maturase HydG n=1 Tax=Candidatus Caldatribacterium sp. TaxID=2282143 RepID=UPI0029919979|nr:[FeFe] hydrogenase H-cluster radical SAM maturase HydG [Candidatus Caldatribacterium sp.]MDW8080634.1 [FeFe] hydrogenase H-cluster radical SAM maturase HydG [Candidatus Calescibacterium sp.]
MQSIIREEEIERYLVHGQDFINDEEIENLLKKCRNPEPQKVRDILAKSLALERLEPEETATLLNVEDEELWEEIFQAAGEVKRKVYGDRIVTFAPLYCSNFCVNNCLYCGFRRDNHLQKRRQLTIEEVRKEAEALVSMGHKRLIMVYGEHPLSDVDYIAKTIQTVYDTKVGKGEIRRVNVNAAPMDIARLKVLKEVGIGTFQVFQETYHHETYKRVHPEGTIKAHYRWRLYALHRAQEAGIDDVAIGALFGLYDWKFEVMGLLYHTIDLERHFGGVGPHTISFPRLEPAINTPFVQETRYRVSDRDFKRLVAVIRLSVPYTGMIITAREPAHIRREVIPVGCTQTDASTRIGIGAYSERYTEQDLKRQQFQIGDPRSLDEVVRELAAMGYITSFCTADYRCGRTGKYFMGIAKKGKIHHFCMPNAILTFKEYLIDYASPETRKVGEELIERKFAELDESLKPIVREYLTRIEHGERDLRI